MSFPYRHIILDLGGVVIDLTGTNPVRSLRDALDRTGCPPQRFDERELANLNAEFEVGKLSPLEFRRKLHEALVSDFPDAVFERAWNAILVGVPSARLEFLRKLRERVKLSCLSNTNIDHIHYCDHLMRVQHGVPSLSMLFDKAYFSYEVGMRKPNIEFYQHAVTDSGVPAEETLFVDDAEANIVGAQAIGLKTLHLVDQDLVDALAYLLAP